MHHRGCGAGEVGHERAQRSGPCKPEQCAADDEPPHAEERQQYEAEVKRRPHNTTNCWAGSAGAVRVGVSGNSRNRFSSSARLSAAMIRNCRVSGWWPTSTSAPRAGPIAVFNGERGPSGGLSASTRIKWREVRRPLGEYENRQHRLCITESGTIPKPGPQPRARRPACEAFLSRRRHPTVMAGRDRGNPRC